MPAHVIAVLAVLSFAVPSHSQSPALQQLRQAAGPDFAPAAAQNAQGAPLPQYGNQEQNRAWDELVRPLAAWAAHMDAIDKDYANQEWTLLRLPGPGTTLWGKDIVGRLDLKGRVVSITANRRAELRARQAAHAIAWRLYRQGEMARLDEKGRALAALHLARLTTPEKDVTAIHEKLKSFRGGEPGIISRSLDASLAAGLDDLALSAAHIRAYADATRKIMNPEPAPAVELGAPEVPSADGWRPAKRY